jgi:two-component system response regulator MprA
MSNASRQKPRMLLVDDDQRTSQRLASLLRQDGYRVEVARNGAHAISRLAREPTPDVLVTDLHVRYADGVTVGRFAQSLNRGVRVIIVTGYPNLFVSSAFRGRVPVFTKPLEYHRLCRELEQSLISPPVTDAPVTRPPP